MTPACPTCPAPPLAALDDPRHRPACDAAYCADCYADEGPLPCEIRHTILMEIVTRIREEADSEGAKE